VYLQFNCVVRMGGIVRKVPNILDRSCSIISVMSWVLDRDRCKKGPKDGPIFTAVGFVTR
jgi:hypothetical protein